MKRKLTQRVICLVLTLATLLSALGLTVSAANGEYKENGTASTLDEMNSLVGTKSYEDYLKAWASQQKQKPVSNIVIDVNNSDIFEFSNYGTNDAMKENAGVLYETDSQGNPVFNDDGTYKLKPFFAEEMEKNSKNWEDFDQDDIANSVYLPSIGTATWQFSIPDVSNVGMYYIKIEYFTVVTDESSTSSIERKFMLDGQITFTEAAYVTLDKSWVYSNSKTDRVDVTGKEEYKPPVTSYSDPVENPGAYVKTVVSYEYEGDKLFRVTKTYTIQADMNNNSMAPEAVAVPAWKTYYFKDSSGYYTDNFMFYMSKGDHEFSLIAERDPVIVKSIELIPAEVKEGDATADSTKSYADYRAEHSAAPVGNGTVRIEAEFPDFVSDSSVAPSNDNTSAATFPTNHSSQLYNVIGENGYSSVGQWAAYNFYVTKDGMYKISMRFLQNALQGMYVCRTIKLAGGEYGLADGTPTVPFKEANDIKYNYSKEWQSEFIGDGKGNAYEFYFEEGVQYTIYLECSLGSLKNSIQRVEASLNVINDCYLQILQLTGADPDENRDYRFDDIMPDVLYNFLVQAKELAAVKSELEALCGTNGSHIAQLDTIALLLLQMGSDRGDNVAKNMGSLKSYLGTLGSWINSSKQSTIMVDAIFFVPANASEQPRESDAGFWESLWFEILSFFASFWVDYDEMGLTTEISDDSQKIDVWLATGRDQSQIWRSMIDAQNGYSNSTGTPAALKLVTGGTLLPSILSGKGPDVYIGLAAADVINYAIRGAVIGMNGNDSHRLDADENKIFVTTHYTYRYETNGNYDYVTVTISSPEKSLKEGAVLVEYAYDENLGEAYYTHLNPDKTTVTVTVTDPKEIAAWKSVKEGAELSFITKPYSDVILTENSPQVLNGEEKQVFTQAAMDTLQLLGVTYGVPQTMNFAMMFYRMDVLANLNIGVPETWDDLLSCLPIIQSNNMSIGVDYISALDFMIYQKGGNLWKYTNSDEYDSKYAGARIDLDSDIALEAFEFVCRLYSDYSFPVAYDAANRFRTGEMPILVGSYCALYNQLVVYATEIEGLWEFCSLPGLFRDADGDGVEEIHYESLAGVGATVILRGCDNLLAAWQFSQWNSNASVQAEYGNRMVALIGPSAKYETANLQAIQDLSWTASEKLAIQDQMSNMCSIVNYPGSYIYNRYMKFAFLDAVNNGANAVEALQNYIDAINSEITRKREEFKDRGIWYVGYKNPTTGEEEIDPTPNA